VNSSGPTAVEQSSAIEPPQEEVQPNRSTSFKPKRTIHRCRCRTSSFSVASTLISSPYRKTSSCSPRRGRDDERRTTTDEKQSKPSATQAGPTHPRKRPEELGIVSKLAEKQLNNHWEASKENSRVGCGLHRTLCVAGFTGRRGHNGRSHLRRRKGLFRHSAAVNAPWHGACSPLASPALRADKHARKKAAQWNHHTLSPGPALSKPDFSQSTIQMSKQTNMHCH